MEAGCNKNKPDMKSKTTILSLTAFFLFSLLSSGQTFNKAKEDSLLTLLQEKNKAMGSLAVMNNGKIIYARAIGYSFLEPKKNADINTKYRIGSISKMFTATLVFQLIEEGKLSTDTRLDKFFPSVQNSKDITIGNMLNHRSGIHSITDDPDYHQYMTQPKTKKEIVDLISKGKPQFNPGEKFSYSNSNYILLGYIVEELRKQPYDQVLQNFICSRIGLQDTYYGGKPDNSKNESASFEFKTTWVKLPETDMSIPHGAGAIVSTPSDLVKFITALFDGKLVKKESFERMMDIKDGMGMGIQQFPYENKKVYGHGGGIDGFSSLLCYLPDSRMAVCYCSNGTVFSVNDIILRTLNNYYGKDQKLPSFTTVNVTPEALEKLKGVYSTPSFPLKLTIIHRNGKLFGQGTGQPEFPLEPSAENVFRFEPAGIVITFTATDSFILDQGGAKMTFKKEQ